MILIYGEMRQNSIRVQSLYAEQYPNRTHPTHQTFQRLCNKLKETGNLGTRKSSRRKRATDERNEVGVLTVAGVHNPQISTRQIERESAIGRRRVLRILARHKFHTYHITLHQELYATDFMNRVAFCQRALQKIQIDETWLVNVWCGIIGDQIIGPHFIDGNLTGERYAHFIRSRLSDYCRSIDNKFLVGRDYNSCIDKFKLTVITPPLYNNTTDWSLFKNILETNINCNVPLKTLNE
ncbi:hypothetical protein WN55_05885 [Dufourea novaeangliae]|uniref:DUF4817 domain-containing protein n=1 Tax=Dufourea novaeangliae TaxID=178035 RepID=A0A154PPM8_DUFNO|nr:hypothetical protein WN55_05885 [Dufourea novaeangliae]